MIKEKTGIEVMADKLEKALDNKMVNELLKEECGNFLPQIDRLMICGGGINAGRTAVMLEQLKSHDYGCHKNIMIVGDPESEISNRMLEILTSKGHTVTIGNNFDNESKIEFNNLEEDISPIAIKSGPGYAGSKSFSNLLPVTDKPFKMNFILNENTRDAIKDAAEAKARILRQKETILKGISFKEKKKAFTGSKFTPKKKKRK